MERRRKKRYRFTKRFRNICIFLFAALFLFVGWRVLEAKNVSHPNSANPNTANQSAISVPDGYKTVTMTKSDVHTGNLILVNPEYAYQVNENDDLESIYSNKNSAYKVKDTNVLLNKNVITNLNDMMAEFGRIKSNYSVNIVSGYRTEEKQQRLLDDEIANNGETEAATWVAKPGFSEHHSGLAFDLGLYFNDGTSALFDGSDVYAWIPENCWKYGFVVRYPESKKAITKISYEPWHLRYVGAPHAYIMNENGFCFEEYIDFIRDYPFDGEHLAVTANDKNYKIYFTAETDVPVPEKGDFEISGNNVDGFIVTVEE
ncbi:MAG: M15 family metallopeptidase [Clostridiales Family XIII bacterium]|jgi:D-alanyl-D-alanine carboxypeptidase|nr:M15 family metallopeptidase [Clostridiales Family XIII bacterium]